jgi:hypothetical protein
LFGGIYDDSLLPLGLLVVCLLYLGCVFGVLVKVLVVHGAQVMRVFALVLLDVSLIYPVQGIHKPSDISVEKGAAQFDGLHQVQSGGDIAHHRHEEEGHLKDRVLKELQAIHDALIPGGVVHVDDKREDP